MTEEKVKKRGWIKNVAIIFLAVMLVLTFFSNTFMNRSLPEVAAQYVQGGSINAKIRGSGTVTANESFDVKSTQTRKVMSVPVKVGDKVAVGDVLVNFGDAGSEELKTAQDELDALVLAYKKAVIAAGGADYAKQQRDIRLAQEDLDKSKIDRDKNYIEGSTVETAKVVSERAKMELTLQDARVKALQDELAGLSPGTNNSAAITAKNAEIKVAQGEYDAAMLNNKTGYENIVKCATAWKTTDNSTKDIEVYKAAFGKLIKSWVLTTVDGTTTVTLPTTKPAWWPNAVTYDDKSVLAMATAYDQVNPALITLTRLQAELNALYGEGGGSWNYENVKKKLNEAVSIQTNLSNISITAEATLKTYTDKKELYDAAVKAVSTNQRALEDQIFALAEQQKTDGKTAATESLDISNMKKGIDDKNKQLENLKGGGQGASVVSPVNGVVASVAVSAGNNAEKDASMMVVEVPDMGYNVSFPVTVEQSKKVSIGEAGEIQYNYWGSDISATLAGIKTDPKDPSTKKLLVFKLGGEVTSGSQVSLTIGEKGSSYDTIVPTSAVRSDNNGEFVLAVVSKSSPLGNRYVAKRIDVKVLAKDDVSSAVSGALTNSDFVITTSTKPIEPGMLVRLPDNA